MPSADLRTARCDDAAALAALRWRFRVELDPPVESEAMFLRRCTTWMEAALRAPAWSAWLATDDGEPVGCCWLQLVAKVPNPVEEAELHAYVTNEYVVPERRRQGIGDALLQRAVAAAASAGVDELVLWRSEGARSLYARNGFVEPAPRVMTRRP